MAKIERHFIDKPEFYGVNREDVLQPRPRYVLVFCGEGTNITISDNDGFVHHDCEGSFIIISDSLSASRIHIPFVDLVSAAEKAGYELICNKVSEESILTIEDLYNKSKAVGLDTNQPIVGRGKVCKNCPDYYKNIMFRKIDGVYGKPSDGVCIKSNDGVNVKLERYNDKSEYCLICDEEV